MRYAYAVTHAETFSAVVRDAQPLIASLTSYASWLKTLGTVEEPRGIVFHDLASATTVFSEYVLPAWTNMSLIHLDPVIDDWKHIYLSALAPDLSGPTQALVADYYQSLDALEIATIAMPCACAPCRMSCIPTMLIEPVGSPCVNRFATSSSAALSERPRIMLKSYGALPA